MGLLVPVTVAWPVMLFYKESVQPVKGNQWSWMLNTLCYSLTVTRRGGGDPAVKGCLLIAQLEVAFVKSKFYLFKMAPRLSSKMHGVAWIHSKFAINSPSKT